MVEWHIELTLSVCVCFVCVCFGLCDSEYVRPITSSCMIGFENNLAQMVIKTRRCIMNKNPVARSKINGIVKIRCP